MENDNLQILEIKDDMNKTSGTLSRLFANGIANMIYENPEEEQEVIE